MVKIPKLVSSLPPYIPGKPIESVAREFGLPVDSIAKLASNENPLGASPAAREAAIAALSRLHLYPDNDSCDLKAAIGAQFGFSSDSIVLGTGSVELIEAAIHACLDSGEQTLFSQYAFAIYKIATLASNHGFVEVPATPELGHDLEAFLRLRTEKTRVILVANPNNPTGTMLTRKELTQFLDRVPEEVLVVLDEAYAEFVQNPEYPNGLDLLREGRRNLLVLRTFSKVHGLASLRIGYGFSSAEVCSAIEKVRTYFNLSQAAQAAAVASLADREHLQRSVAHVHQERTFVSAELTRLGVKWHPCEGNFLLLDMGRPAAPLFDALQREGVIVRPVANYGLPNHLRLSYGLRTENERFLKALEKLLPR